MSNFTQKKFFTTPKSSNGNKNEVNAVSPVVRRTQLSLTRMMQNIRLFVQETQKLLIFFVQLTCYFLWLSIQFIGKSRLWNTTFGRKFHIKGDGVYRLLLWIGKTNGHSISRVALITLSLRNMKLKRTRTLVTMGGMALGIAFIVFLVSVGYGLQNLVISRVVRLDELKQADVLPGLSDSLSLTDETVSNLSAIPHVESTLPVIAVVGRLNYKQSVSDIAVYGVTSDYLKYSAVQPIQGKIFESTDIVTSLQQTSQAPEVLEIQEDVDVSDDSIQEVTVIQQQSTGSLPLVDISSASATRATTVKVLHSASPKKEVVVNESTLRLLGIEAVNAVGQTIEITFVVVSNLIPGVQDKVESYPEKYTIVGVISDSETPVVYVPFINLRSLGISHFSQIKVRVKDSSSLADVRKAIESNGYGTVSVADTVEQINTLFSNVRLLLSVLGMVALSVASLGMFNTLTVSLLERTREVGLMKAMGMKSHEVQDLFLTESMIMGFFGGIAGLLFGILFGKIVSMLLSVFSIMRGVGFIDITYVPPMFIFLVLVLSIFVGIFTGLYPAHRATKISALNALRYE